MFHVCHGLPKCLSFFGLAKGCQHFSARQTAYLAQSRKGNECLREGTDSMQGNPDGGTLPRKKDKGMIDPVTNVQARTLHPLFPLRIFSVHNHLSSFGAGCSRRRDSGFTHIDVKRTHLVESELQNIFERFVDHVLKGSDQVKKLLTAIHRLRPLSIKSR